MTPNQCAIKLTLDTPGSLLIYHDKYPWCKEPRNATRLTLPGSRIAVYASTLGLSHFSVANAPIRICVIK